MGSSTRTMGELSALVFGSLWQVMGFSRRQSILRADKSLFRFGFPDPIVFG